MPKATAVERSKITLFVLGILMYGLSSSYSSDPTTVALEAVYLPSAENFMFRYYHVLHTTVCFLAGSCGSAVLWKKKKKWLF